MLSSEYPKHCQCGVCPECVQARKAEGAFRLIEHFKNRDTETAQKDDLRLTRMGGKPAMLAAFLRGDFGEGKDALEILDKKLGDWNEQHGFVPDDTNE